ncbi:hypothetical protein RJ641_026580 [Dillenia turbinata]|uniref:Uncharacterized protein n=1 Tax=Dillenia turbinata TaxID=194707 RepID=A0AAN8W769_9MAGN
MSLQEVNQRTQGALVSLPRNLLHTILLRIMFLLEGSTLTPTELTSITRNIVASCITRKSRETEHYLGNVPDFHISDFKELDQAIQGRPHGQFPAKFPIIYLTPDLLQFHCKFGDRSSLCKTQPPEWQTIVLSLLWLREQERDPSIYGKDDQDEIEKRSSQ